MYLPCVINEYNVLSALTDRLPSLTYHPLAMVTTPYDVAYNRAKESVMMAHGSCGLGVGTTMKRSIETPHKLYVQDFQFMPLFMEKMKEIGHYYGRLTRTNADLFNAYQEHLKPVLETFMDSLSKIAVFNRYFKIGNISPKFRQEVIFEGSQGIMLDMDHGAFPNVTYANTTSKNVFKYVEKWGLVPEMYYVTRCYTTRHGLGWMPNEKPILLTNTHEEINVHNQWQGDFRVGDISYEMINHSIRVDSNYHGNWRPKKNLVITCLDQRPEFELEFDRIEGIDHFYTNHSAQRGNIRPVTR
jgi:adenylosuccinate synthase